MFREQGVGASKFLVAQHEAIDSLGEFRQA